MSAFIAVGRISYLCDGRKTKHVSSEMIDRTIEETSEEVTRINM